MNEFYEFFCQVDSLCYVTVEGLVFRVQPHWLGWIVIVVIGILIFGLFLWLIKKFLFMVVGAQEITDAEEAHKRRRYKKYERETRSNRTR